MEHLGSLAMRVLLVDIVVISVEFPSRLVCIVSIRRVAIDFTRYLVYHPPLLRFNT